MDNPAPTASAPPTSSHRLRWLWRSCFAVILIGFVWGVYLIITTRPALYSPAATVRKSSYYLLAMNPPAAVAADTTTTVSPAPPVKVVTNGNHLRIEYRQSDEQKTVEPRVLVHHITGGETAVFDDTSFRLKRIAHGWVPPSTNSSGSGYHNNITAHYFTPDLQPIPDAQMQRELPQSWERSVNVRDNRNTFRFDFEILGPAWKFQSLALFDARTQNRLTDGSSSRGSKDGYRVELDPFLWHQAPVELIADITTGPMEEEEILPQAGAFFSVGAARYHLIFTADGLSGNYYGHGSDGKLAYVELQPPPAHQKKKECVFLLAGFPASSQSPFELEYLDANGKPLKTIGFSRSGSKVLQGVEASIQDVKKIRVRKYTATHRVVIRLPELPNLPPGNRNLDNLFAIRVPQLRFEREYEHDEFIRRIAQLDMPHLTGTPLPAGTYPRSFTNVTVMQVLQDYAQVHGIPGQLHVNQEKLSIEEGPRHWPEEVKEKLVNLWEKLRGP